MARSLRLESEAGLYHVLKRGNDRLDLFRAEKAKAAFLLRADGQTATATLLSKVKT